MKSKGMGANASPTVVATTGPHVSGDVVGTRTDGEFPGVGSVYAATLNERENKSNTRNRGPSRDPGVVGGAKLPAMGMASRQTGRVASVTVTRRGGGED